MILEEEIASRIIEVWNSPSQYRTAHMVDILKKYSETKNNLQLEKYKKIVKRNIGTEIFKEINDKFEKQ